MSTWFLDSELSTCCIFCGFAFTVCIAQYICILCASIYRKEDVKLVSYDFDASLSKLPIVRVAAPNNLAINNLTANMLKEK